MNYNTDSFLSRNPLFCSLMLICGAITNKSQKVIKTLPHFFYDSEMKELYLTNSRLLLEKMHLIERSPEELLKNLLDKSLSEMQYVEQYKKIDKRSLSSDCLLYAYRKSFNKNSTRLTEIILEDLPLNIMPKALIMAVRYDKKDILEKLYSENQYTNILNFNDFDNLGKILHVAIKNQSMKSLDYLFNETPCKELLSDAKYVSNMLNICHNDHLKKSLIYLDKFNLNLEQSGHLSESNLLSEYAPNMKKRLLPFIMEEENSRITRL